MVILAIALVNFFVGSAIGPRSEESESRGFLGYDGNPYTLTTLALSERPMNFLCFSNYYQKWNCSKKIGTRPTLLTEE